MDLQYKSMAAFYHISCRQRGSLGQNWRRREGTCQLSRSVRHKDNFTCTIQNIQKKKNTTVSRKQQQLYLVPSQDIISTNEVILSDSFPSLTLTLASQHEPPETINRSCSLVCVYWGLIYMVIVRFYILQALLKEEEQLNFADS